MSEDVEQRLTALEGEIANLNRKLKSLFNIIDTSTDKEPFMRLMVSVDATEAQETAIYDLMGEVDDALAQAKPAMGYVAFCDRVYQVFPDHRQHRLAESIVMRLAKEGGWEKVYEHLRQSGMNLRDLREERGY